jgi:hypothetical protein
VTIKGKRGKETICVVLGDEGVDANLIRMNKIVRAWPPEAGGAARAQRKPHTRHAHSLACRCARTCACGWVT